MHATDKLYYVYIMTNRERGVFYVGVTSDLIGRVWLHREQAQDGFVKQYKLRRLVWFEAYEDVHAAIAQEKKLKRWRRQWKIDLIEKMNPDWRNLWYDLEP